MRKHGKITLFDFLLQRMSLEIHLRSYIKLTNKKSTIIKLIISCAGNSFNQEPQKLLLCYLLCKACVPYGRTNARKINKLIDLGLSNTKLLTTS